MLGNGMNPGSESIMTSSTGTGIMTGPPPLLDGTQQYCLRWNSYPATIATQLASLRIAEDFVDVTLACDGQQLRAHKLVLSACSPYFMQLFKSTPCQHPVVFFKDVRFNQLRALLEFMYAGEVNVSQTELPALLRTAEALQVRGLADTTNNNNFPHPPEKPIFSQHQQYVPVPNPAVVASATSTIVSTMSTQAPSQIHSHSSHQIQMETNGGNPHSHLIIPVDSNPATSRITSEISKGGVRDESGENESSKENQMDASSSDSNDSQEDYNATLCEEKGNLNNHEQPILPFNDNSFSNLSHAREDGSQSWSVGLGTSSFGENQSEAELSDDHDDDDGEIHEEDPLLLSSDPFAFHNLEKVNANGENSAGPSMSNSFSLHPGNLDKSKDLNPLSSNGGDLLDPPRNRLSRPLLPPGIPYNGPQQCLYCPRRLSNVGNWRKHVLTMHYAREKIFKCCHCSSSFRTSEYLQKHYVRVHAYAPKMSRKKGLGSSVGVNPQNPSAHTPNIVCNNNQSTRP